MEKIWHDEDICCDMNKLSGRCSKTHEECSVVLKVTIKKDYKGA